MKICLLEESIYGITDIVDLLEELDNDFNPPFNTRVESFSVFVKKLIKFGNIHIVSYGNEIAGTIGYYCNDFKTFKAYITFLGVLEKYRSRGVAVRLLKAGLLKMQNEGMQKVGVITDNTNSRAIAFYHRNGFQVAEVDKNRKISKNKILLEYAFSSEIE